MNFIIGVSLLFGLTCVPLGSHTFSNGEVESDGLGVAYAASYSTDFRDEPQYELQNEKTFSYLTLGNSLDSYRGDSVKVGIIDSGCNYDHEDFMEDGNTKVQDQSRSYKYNVDHWEYYTAKSFGYSYVDDSLGHGSNVAATVAASLNSIGGFGIAPNVELYVFKVTNSNNGYEFGAIQAALTNAIELGIDVINMSFQSYEHDVTYGGKTQKASTGCSTVLSTFINKAYNAGITLVGAAGNYDTDEPSYPGSNNYVINVGSFSSTDKNTKAAFSNYGSTIDLVAPGYVHVAGKGDNDYYVDTSGTSFSAPLVTGAIALYKQKNPEATPSQIEQALYNSCDPIEGTDWAGHGSLNVSKLLGLDVTPESVSVSLTKPSIKVGDLTTAKAEVFPAEAGDKSVTWSSSNPTVATIDDKGIISAKSIGTTTIKAVTNIGSKESTATLTVEEGYVRYSVEPESATISLDQTAKIAVYGNYASGDKDLIDPSECAFDSENESVCKVDDNGQITPIGVGTTIVEVMTPDLEIVEIPVTIIKQVIDTGNAEISKSSFTSVNDNLDGNISYKSYEWHGTTKPIINNNHIRLYRNSNGKAGNYIEITGDDTHKIRTIIFQTATKTTYGCGPTKEELVEKEQIEINVDTIITDLDNKSYCICNFGKDKNQQLDISKLTVYYWDSIKEATEWCQIFIDTLDCDPTGKKPPSQSLWDELADSYSKLQSTTKTYLSTAESSKEPTQTIGFAMNNYDLVMTKYDLAIYKNFIGREVKGNNHNNPVINDSKTLLPIVVLISLISVSSITAFVFVKKRKEK